MSFNFFGFGRKKTRKTRKTSRKSVRKTAKPVKSLVNLCKKYGVKVTKKVGSKRVYKKISVLKKQCSKKIRSLIKRKYKFGARRTRFGVTPKRRTAPHRVVKSSMMVTGVSKPLTKPSFLRRHGGKIALGIAGLSAAALAAGRYGVPEYKARRSALAAGEQGPLLPGARGVFNSDLNRASGAFNSGLNRSKLATRQFARKHGMMDAASLPGGSAEADVYSQAAMAKRGAMAKTDAGKKRLALKALGKFRTNNEESYAINKAREMPGWVLFGKRRRRGGYRFGSGGNPSLSQTMGYEFCSGGGGVLGANSTGLFPSPCMGAAMPTMMAGPAAAFGKRRRRTTRRM